MVYDSGVTSCLLDSASRVSMETPSHSVPNLDHFVTQWMSAVIVDLGRAWNSSQLHRTDLPFVPRSVRSHLESAVRGVRPAESTGKSRVSYWPGGRRPGWVASRR